MVSHANAAIDPEVINKAATIWISFLTAWAYQAFLCFNHIHCIGIYFHLFAPTPQHIHPEPTSMSNRYRAYRNHPLSMLCHAWWAKLTMCILIINNQAPSLVCILHDSTGNPLAVRQPINTFPDRYRAKDKFDALPTVGWIQSLWNFCEKPPVAEN